jgi:hypothetical protein
VTAVILLFTLCAIAQPMVCKHERLLLNEDIAVGTCQVVTPRIISAWIGEHGAQGFVPARWQRVESENEGKGSL